MKFDLMWALTFGVTLVGFVSVWFRIGSSQGRQEKTLETLSDRIRKAEGDIIELQRGHADLRVSIAAFMGKIEAKLDYIKESVTALKGGRRAEEK